MLPKKVELVFDEKMNWLCFPLFGLLNVCLADNCDQDGTSFNSLASFFDGETGFHTKW
jgi:hypothetical protein